MEFTRVVLFCPRCLRAEPLTQELKGVWNWWGDPETQFISKFGLIPRLWSWLYSSPEERLNAATGVLKDKEEIRAIIQSFGGLAVDPGGIVFEYYWELDERWLQNLREGVAADHVLGFWRAFLTQSS